MNDFKFEIIGGDDDRNRESVNSAMIRSVLSEVEACVRCGQHAEFVDGDSITYHPAPPAYSFMSEFCCASCKLGLSAVSISTVNNPEFRSFDPSDPWVHRYFLQNEPWAIPTTIWRARHAAVPTPWWLVIEAETERGLLHEHLFPAFEVCDATRPAPCWPKGLHEAAEFERKVWPAASMLAGVFLAAYTAAGSSSTAERIELRLDAANDIDYSVYGDDIPF